MSLSIKKKDNEMQKSDFEEILESLCEIFENGKKKNLLTIEEAFQLVDKSNQLAILTTGNFIKAFTPNSDKRAFAKNVLTASMQFENALVDFTGVSAQEISELVLTELKGKEASEEMFVGTC
jgi:hypothetical protein